MPRQLVILIALVGLPVNFSWAADEPTYLTQTLTESAREYFYQKSLGSQLIPFTWFRALQKTDGQPFADAVHLQQFGFLFEPNVTEINLPLPIGMAKDSDPVTGAWLGLTCAACHTGEWRYQTHKVRIDGGPGRIDLVSFEQSLVAALESVDTSEERFQSFSQKVLKGDSTAEAVEQLRRDLRQQTRRLTERVARNRPSRPPGPGRLDFLGIQLNEVFGAAISQPGNCRTPDAPVSIPALWGTHEFEWTMWNGAVHSPLVRNVGEALGVYAKLSVSETDFRTRSTIRVKDLHQLEEILLSITPPPWPGEVFGAIDAEKVAAGKKLYDKQGCATCHEPELSMPYLFKRKFRQTRLIPYTEVKTDSTAAVAFAKRTAVPGLFASRLTDNADKKRAADSPVLLPDIYVDVMGDVMRDGFTELNLDLLARIGMVHGAEPTRRPSLEQQLSYKAVPLSGVWATAPYLHNGSVATLFELFVPSAKRQKQFRVSNRFDPAKVGCAEGLDSDWKFDTTLPGNSNAGHEYGTSLSDAERMELVEYLKTL